MSEERGTPIELERELESLLSEFPLGPSWGQPRSFFETVDIGDLRLHLVGLIAAQPSGADVAGSAAQVSSHPVRRAYFELFERSALFDAMARARGTHALLDEQGKTVGQRDRALVFPEAPATSAWGFAKSNGVAAGSDWSSACRSARAELFERHAVLSSWYGLSVPERMDLPTAAVSDPVFYLQGLYDFESYAFALDPGASLEVVGVFGFPTANGSPLVCGFGAAPDRAGALLRARSECLQRLAFLWGEQIPSAEPVPGKTPDYHQEWFLWPPMHSRLRVWLAGEHAGRAAFEATFARTLADHANDPVCFVDLTPPHCLSAAKPGVRVAKALCPALLPLTFGRGHPNIVTADERLAVHPVA